MAAVETGKKLRRVKISGIIPSPHQTRVFAEGWEELESTREMVQSIRDHGGVFQPPLVRQSALGKYILIAGERRLRCSRLAGLKEINVIVADISEKEAAKITASENYHREDLSIIEEAAAIKVLIEAYDGDVKEVAEYIDKSERWIRNWAKIADMDECWKEEMEVLSKWKAGHWRVIASLPADTQLDVYRNHKERGWWLSNDMTVNNIKSALASYFCELSEAIWPLHLFKGSCGRSCDSCVKRSDAQKNLFDEEVQQREDARCLDKGCFENKGAEYIAEEYRKAKIKYGEELLLGSESWYPNPLDNKLQELCGGKVLQSHDYSEAQKKTAGARAIFMIDGDDLCKVEWCIYKEQEETEPEPEETAEEKEERKKKEKIEQKKREIAGTVNAMLSYKFRADEDYLEDGEQIKTEIGGEVSMPDITVLARLVFIVEDFDEIACCCRGNDEKERVQLVKDLQNENIKTRHHEFVFEKIKDGLSYEFLRNSADIKYSGEICRIFGLDYKALKAEAVKVIAEKKDED